MWHVFQVVILLVLQISEMIHTSGVLQEGCHKNGRKSELNLPLLVFKKKTNNSYNYNKSYNLLIKT